MVLKALNYQIQNMDEAYGTTLDHHSKPKNHQIQNIHTEIGLVSSLVSRLVTYDEHSLSNAFNLLAIMCILSLALDISGESELINS